MNGFYSLIIAVSMYSKFPMPTINWTRERMGYVMCWFPVVGILEGLALWLLQAAGAALGFSAAGRALAAAALPLLVTGGIHMDGFLDTMDAIHSYGDREKKLEILKDPHVGAFAVIGCGGYLLLYAAAAYEVTVLELWPLALPVLVMERALSGLSVVFFPCAKKSGLAATFS
ncbi:MAG: adenosylcobinamide-GDP ribazoletransferase, partial [Clostridium sp.]|nr:adenosylcobinamide-GDP ribazoletransferase [Clostridium sp.]